MLIMRRNIIYFSRQQVFFLYFIRNLLEITRSEMLNYVNICKIFVAGSFNRCRHSLLCFAEFAQCINFSNPHSVTDSDANISVLTNAAVRKH